MKKLIAFVLAAGMAAPAFAWGDREQGILTGIAAVLLLQNQQRQVYVPPQPVYVQPAPVIIYQPTCRNEPIFDQWGRHIGYRQVCY